MKLAAIVVARKGSKRIPDKRNQLIGEDTLVVRKIKQLKEVIPNPKDIYLGSDDEHLAVVADDLGISFIQRHPDYCDEVSKSPNDMVIDMVNKISNHGDYSHILWAHPTNPFVTPIHYKEAIDCFIKSRKFDSVYSVTKLKGHFINDLNQPINFSFDSGIHKVAREIPPVYVTNGGIFIRDVYSMQSDGSFFGAKPKMYIMDEISGWDIDEPWQLAAARMLYENNLSFS